MNKKNGHGKRTVKDLPPRKGQDVKGGDKAAAPVLGNTWGNKPGGDFPAPVLGNTWGGNDSPRGNIW